jgi:hypothetical protein
VTRALIADDQRHVLEALRILLKGEGCSHRSGAVLRRHQRGEGEARWVQASPTVDNGVVHIPNYGDGTVAAFGLNAPTLTATLLRHQAQR